MTTTSGPWIIDTQRRTDASALARVAELGIETIVATPPERFGLDRTPVRRCWISGQDDALLTCSRCGDRAKIGSTTPHAPRCSCEALAVLDAERDAASLAILADPRAARSGRCCIAGCEADGRHWERMTTIAGARAVRTCDRHELLGPHLLSRLTMADAVRLATRAQRRSARSAITAAARHDEMAAAARRTSASLEGASSLTHTYALVAGWHEQEAYRQRAFAEALAAAPEAAR